MFAIGTRLYRPGFHRFIYRPIHQKHIDMKKFLEVLVDDEGAMHFSTDYDFPDSLFNASSGKFLKDYLDLDKRAVRGLVEEGWRKKNGNPHKAIRCLAMAEILSCAEPYSRAEEFWSMMMFDYIPLNEKFASDLKRPFGYNPDKMIRPITGVFPGGVPPYATGSKLN